MKAAGFTAGTDGGAGSEIVNQAAVAKVGLLFHGKRHKLSGMSIVCQMCMYVCARLSV
jgi:hypothetical protein